MQPFCEVGVFTGCETAPLPLTNPAFQECLDGKPEFRRRAASLAGNIALIAVSVIVSLMVLELGWRLVRSGPQALVHWPNLARQHMGNSEDDALSCAYAHDATLGWRLPSGCTSSGYNTDADGFRRVPGRSAAAPPAVLATGSSFAQGQEVSDGETWPAYLQDLVGRKVVNAGVSGYSFDQTVLRTERLAARLKPPVIVTSFTAADIHRSELKVAWSRQKPYFAVTDGRLELRNVPVPTSPGASVALPVAARLVGWSMLADEVAQRLAIQNGWYFDEVRALPRGTGETVACLLMTRLAALGVPVMVVAQYSRGDWLSDEDAKARATRSIRKVLGCAADAGLIAFDLHEPLRPALEARGIDALYRQDHHSAAGNRVTADLILRELVRRRLLPATER